MFYLVLDSIKVESNAKFVRLSEVITAGIILSEIHGFSDIE